jgi:hypothetical protein
MWRQKKKSKFDENFLFFILQGFENWSKKYLVVFLAFFGTKVKSVVVYPFSTLD